MKHLKFLVAFLFLLTTTFLRAAPPTDLSDVDGSDSNKKVIQKRITEDELTFTSDEAAAKATAIGKSPQIRFNVYGKNLPGRAGKNILPMAKGSRVQILKESKDKKWWAVQSLQGKKARAWVPKSAVLIPPKTTSP